MSSQPGHPPEGLFPEPTRRDVLRTSATAAATGMVVPAMVSAQQTQATAPSTGAMETLQGEVAVELNVNGKNMALKVEPRTTLLDAFDWKITPVSNPDGFVHTHTSVIYIFIETIKCF